METQKKNYVLPIAMMFALFAMISFVTGLQNPMGIIVKNQFGASNFMSQLGNNNNISLKRIIFISLKEHRQTCYRLSVIIRHAAAYL